MTCQQNDFKGNKLQFRLHYPFMSFNSNCCMFDKHITIVNDERK
jgi:hypothetical protein